MKKQTVVLALALFAGSVGLAMADPYVYANVRIAPGIQVGFSNGPVVVENVRRAPLPVVVSDRCEPAKVVVRPYVEKRVAFLNRWEKNHRNRFENRFDRRVENRVDRDDYRGHADNDRFNGDHGRRD